MIQQLGPYRIERVLGRGGMGTVYVGVHQQSGQRAAIKVLAPGLAVDEGFRARFAAEIETLKTLKHPHIVDLYGYGEQDSHLFYAMELVEATSLHEELAAGRRFEWREVTRIGTQVCAALKHAHDHGVIHRDLKPANLLLDAEDQIHLTDFGIAKFFGQTSLTVAGGVLGTADYMAPEQAEGRGTTVRSDLYSLGSVLYALLAGRPPFCGKSLPEVVHMVRFDRPLPVRRLAPGVPAEFESILEQLLQKEPEERIPTALALSNRLRAMEHALTLRSGDQGDHNGALTQQESDSGTDRPASISSADGPGETLPGTIADLRDRFDESVANRDTMDVSMDAHPEAYVAKAGSPIGRKASGDSVVLPTVETAGHGTGTGTSFIEIDDQKRREAFEPVYSPDGGGTAWWKIALGTLLLVLVVASAWHSRRPWSADQLYQRITANAASGNSRLLTQAEQDVQQFEERFAADSRLSELAALREEIALAQLDLRLQRIARRSPADWPDLSPVEQLYVDAIRTQQTSPEAAAERLEGLIQLLDRNTEESSDTEDSSESRSCVVLAKRELEVLRGTIEAASAPHLEFIESQLRAAEQKRQDDPDAARDIWQGIIRLYADRPWAAYLVQRARESLASGEGSDDVER